jgi:hypothetical protein
MARYVARASSAPKATPLTASHDWTLDEQGDWREHKDETVASAWQLSVDPVNAYTQWKGW